MSIQDVSSLIMSSDLSDFLSGKSRSYKSLSELLQFGDQVVLVSETGELFRAKKYHGDESPWSFVADKGAFHGTVYPPDSILIVLKSKDPKFIALSSNHADGKLLRATNENGLQLQFHSQYIGSSEMWTISGKSFHKCCLVNSEHTSKRIMVTIQRILTPIKLPMSDKDDDRDEVEVIDDGVNGFNEEANDEDFEVDSLRSRISQLQKKLSDSNRARKSLLAEVRAMKGVSNDVDAESTSGTETMAAKLRELQQQFKNEMEERDRKWIERISKVKGDCQREYFEKLESELKEGTEASKAHFFRLSSEEIAKSRLELEARIAEKVHERVGEEKEKLELVFAAMLEKERARVMIEVEKENEIELLRCVEVEKRKMELEMRQSAEERVQEARASAIAAERAVFEERIVSLKREMEAAADKRVAEKLKRLDDAAMELTESLREGEMGRKSEEIAPKNANTRISELEWNLKVLKGQLAVANERAEELAGKLRGFEISCLNLEEKVRSQRSMFEGELDEARRESSKNLQELVAVRKEADSLSKKLAVASRELAKRNERIREIERSSNKVSEAENGRKVWEQKCSFTERRLFQSEEKRLTVERKLLEVETTLSLQEKLQREVSCSVKSAELCEKRAETAEAKVEYLEMILGEFQKACEENEKESSRKWGKRERELLGKLREAEEEKVKAEIVAKQMKVLVVETERQRKKFHSQITLQNSHSDTFLHRNWSELSSEVGQNSEGMAESEAEVPADPAGQSEAVLEESMAENEQEEGPEMRAPENEGISAAMATMDATDEVQSAPDDEVSGTGNFSNRTVEPIPTQEAKAEAMESRDRVSTAVLADTKQEIPRKLILLTLFGVFVVLFKLGLICSPPFVVSLR